MPGSPLVPGTYGTYARVVRCPNGQAGEYFGSRSQAPRAWRPRPVVALFLGRCMADPNTDQDPSRHDGPPVLIRRRLLRVLAAMFAVLMGVAAVEGFWPGGVSAGMALAFLALSAIGVPVLMAHSDPADHPRHPAPRGRPRPPAGAVRAGAPGLAARRPDRARQPPRLPGGAARQLEHASRHRFAAGPAADRRRRPQEGQRRARPRGRRRAPVRGRADRHRRAAPRRPRVPGRRRRVRGRPAERRHRSGLRVARRMLAGALNGGDPRAPDRAVLAVDRRLGLPRAEHEGQPALPPRRRRAVLVQAPRPDERGGLRPGPARRARRRPLDEELSAAIGTIMADKRCCAPVYQPIFSLATGEPIGYEG